jgi:hypothetical protein
MRCSSCECAGDLSGPVGVFVAGEEGGGVRVQRQRRQEKEELMWGPHPQGEAMPLGLVGGRQAGSPYRAEKALNNELTCFIWLVYSPHLLYI